jgi:hypothetical protein
LFLSPSGLSADIPQLGATLLIGWIFPETQRASCAGCSAKINHRYTGVATNVSSISDVLAVAIHSLNRGRSV